MPDFLNLPYSAATVAAPAPPRAPPAPLQELADLGIAKMAVPPESDGTPALLSTLRAARHELAPLTALRVLWAMRRPG